MEKNENKVKRFVEEHKTAIAVTTGLAIGAVVGGAAIYVATGDARKLWDLLGEYNKDNKGNALTTKLFQYASGADYTKRAEPDIGIVKTVGDLGECAAAIMEDYKGDNGLSDEVVGLILFTKKAES